jgi:hypothetical protein
MKSVRIIKRTTKCHCCPSTVVTYRAVYSDPENPGPYSPVDKQCQPTFSVSTCSPQHALIALADAMGVQVHFGKEVTPVVNTVVARCENGSHSSGWYVGEKCGKCGDVD